MSENLNYLSKNIIIFSDTFRYVVKNKISFKSFKENVKKFLLSLLQNNRTVIIPTFNLNFPKSKKMTFADSDISTGLLNKALLKELDFIRTPKPMYNYAVIGSNSKKLIELEQTTAWGEDSLIGYLSMNAATAIGIGTNHKDFGWVTIHSCEEIMKVPYRYFKVFSGKNIELNEKVSEKVYVRDYDNLQEPDETIIYNKIQNEFYENSLNGVNFTYLNLQKYFEEGIRILKDNPYGLVYKNE